MNRDALSLVKEYASIQKKITPLLDRQEEIKSSLMKLLPNGKTESVVGDVTVSDNVTYPISKSGLTLGQKKRILKPAAVDPKKWASMYPDDHKSTRTVSKTQPLKVNVSIHALKK